MISPASAARMAGIARYAREHGWYLMVQDRLGCRPLVWDGDGAITALRSDNATADAARRLARRGIPVVDITISRPDINLPRVVSDNVGIGRIAAEHFAERNFRNTCWFSMSWGNVQKLRYSGFTERCRAERWVAEEALPGRSKDHWAAFMRWMSAKLKAAAKPLGVLTYDEADAARLLEAAEHSGLSVPEELAILSVGNDPLMCENQPVPLSSIDQNLELGGYEAAALLDRLMDGGKPPRRPLLIPPSGIALRRSTDIIASRSQLVRATLDYIAQNIGRPFGAAQIATALHVSRNMLDRLFRADMNRSIGHEILRQRLALAKLLLRNSRKSVEDIAAETGFSSSSYLINTFRAATGMTPRTYRNSASRPVQ